MELEKLLRNLLYRLESIDDESKSNVRKEIIKNLKHHTFIGYVRKVSNGNVKIVLDIFKVINIPYSSKCGNTVKEVPILQYAN